MTNIKLSKLLETAGSFTGMAVAPGEPNTFYLLKQGGQIMKFNRATKTVDQDLFLDLSPEIQAVYREKPMMVKFPDERGLLNLVFHPEYNTVGSLWYGVFVVTHSELANPKMFPNKYRAGMIKETPEPDHMTCISQYRYRKKNDAAMNKASRMSILCFPEPQPNHNGGGLLFDSVGNLWIGTGDGGGAGDKHGPLLTSDPDSFLGFAQDLNSIHGKILRIEINQPMKQVTPYVVPQTNPFVKNGFGLAEVFAWGFRNPWRMSLTSDEKLLVGDVGQGKFESVKEVTSPGNYGWRAYEGKQVFNQVVASWIADSGQSVVQPIINYPREMGVAIVGVYKYQGKNIPSLKDKIIIADHSGRLILVKTKSDLKTLIKLELRFHSLNQDENGELYVFAFNPKTKMGSINMITSNGSNGTKTQMNQPSAPPSSSAPSSSSQSTSTQVTQSIPSQPSHKSHYTPLTRDDVRKIVKQGINKAQIVKSDFRVDHEGKPVSTRMHISIIRRGEPQATLVESMSDAWQGSVDISMRKAYTAMAFSSNQNAMTSRTIGIASQPGAPLWQIGDSNPRGGIISFPGGIPLYKNGFLVGAVGVSGDSPNKDEIIAAAASVGFEAPVVIQSDTVAKLDYIGTPADELTSPSIT